MSGSGITRRWPLIAFCRRFFIRSLSPDRIIGYHPTDSDRVIVEAYPALVARNFIGRQSYKNDTKSKQKTEYVAARRDIANGLCSDKLRKYYGFDVELTQDMKDAFVEDATGDRLDSLLCAVQAGWAYENKEKNYGIPADCDRLEGWIVDPAMEQKELLFPLSGESADE